jgi:hypothetical protein
VILAQTPSYDQRYRIALALLDRKEYVKAKEILVP